MVDPENPELASSPIMAVLPSNPPWAEPYLEYLTTKNDEDLSMEYDDSTCLSWKEILSLTNNYDKVNSFLIEENVLISLNYILPKAKYCVVFRYMPSIKISPVGGEGGRRSRDKWRSSLHEHEHVMAH
jgi:hypothetical protein